MLYGVVELLACWSSKFKIHRAMVIWSMILLCLVGYLEGSAYF